EHIKGLNRCYRCPDKVVRYSRNLISKNRKRIDKEWLESEKDGFVKIDQTKTHKELFKRICASIKSNQQSSPGNSTMILSPVRYYADLLADTLKSQNIEFQNFWSSVISPKEQESIWWLNAIFGDNQLLFLMFLGKAQGWISRKVYLRHLSQILHDEHSITNLLEYFYKSKLIRHSLLRALSEDISVDAFLRENEDFKSFSDYLNYENISESLQNIVNKIKPASVFMENGVNIMTIHKSKGLQADFVFIINLNDGVIPNQTKGTKSTEAWRRLLFVGMTRALKGLYLLSTVEWDGKYVNINGKTGFIYDYFIKRYKGGPSRFIEEMKTEYSSSI
ncbi:MAG: ATP-binding domain-containing protein, partial [Candidatus Cloacimonetes bacterium]|nr:ATP-binding domain-containing protein [Candidatus Cloacimonadota bacterium]